MVELINVSKKYKNKTILEDVNYCFLDNGVYLLRGKSGVGKTTLLKIIAGLIKHEGEINGNEDVFFLPFNDYLINEFSVNEIIKLENEIYGSSKSIKDALGIDELKNKKCSKLSLGEKQRVGIYLALCSDCKIILLDEPLAGLDKNYRSRVVNLIKKESKKRLFIIVSHDFSVSNDEVRLEIKNFRLIGEVLSSKKENKKKHIIRGKVSYKWGLLLHFKQFISRFIFIISCIGILGLVSSIKKETTLLMEEFNKSFSSEYIYHKINDKELNDDIFYDVIVSSLSKEIESFYVYNYSEEMYEGDILVNGYYLDNGFLFSDSIYFEGLDADEVVLEINKSEFCGNNKLFYCSEESIKEILLGTDLVYTYNDRYINLKIIDVFLGEENILYIGDIDSINSQIKLLHNNTYSRYMIVIDNDNLSHFYQKINSVPTLANYDFIEVYSDETFTGFMINLSETSYFYLEELNNNSLVACSDIGFSCNVFDFSKFKSLVFINGNNVENNINYKNIDRDLKFNEIIISRGLSEYLGCNIGDIVELRFYFDDEYHIVDNVKVIEIVEDDGSLSIYHSDYDYNLFMRVFNKQIRIKYVYSKLDLEEYKVSNAIYYDDLESIKSCINEIVNIINIVIYIFSFLMILIMFLIEGSKLRRHSDFFKLLHLKKIKSRHLFNAYMSLYLICSLIFLTNVALFLIYLLLFVLFYEIEDKKIRPLVGP